MKQAQWYAYATNGWVPTEEPVIPKYVELKTSKIKYLIKQKQLKKWWCAEQIGIHEVSFRKWLDNRTGKVRVENARKLAEVIEEPLDAIIKS